VHGSFPTSVEYELTGTVLRQ